MRACNILPLLSLLALASAGSAARAQATPSPFPYEARCAALGVWGENHAANDKVRLDMLKMSVFYLGKLAVLQPDRHWIQTIVAEAQRNVGSPKDNAGAVAACLRSMQPYLNTQATGPRTKT